MMRDRAWRRQQRRRIINNRFRLLRLMSDDRYDTLARGRVANQDPFGCPRPRCGLCHPHKKWRGNHKYFYYIRKEPLVLLSIQFK